MKIEIPKNTYSVDAEPAIAETIRKCIARLESYERVIIYRHSLGEYDIGVNADFIGYEVCHQFAAAGYHTAVYIDGNVRHFIVSKTHIDESDRTHIIH